MTKVKTKDSSYSSELRCRGVLITPNQRKRAKMQPQHSINYLFYSKAIEPVIKEKATALTGEVKLLDRKRSSTESDWVKDKVLPLKSRVSNTTENSTDIDDSQCSHTKTSLEPSETKFKANGYIHSIQDQTACAVLTKPSGDVKLYLTKNELEPLKLYRKGAHFELVVERKNGYMSTSIIPTPEAEDSQYLRAAKKVNLSFFSK